MQLIARQVAQLSSEMKGLMDELDSDSATLQDCWLGNTKFQELKHVEATNQL